MSDDRDAEGRAAAGLPKEDPESLVLRGRPRAVVRFRRGLIIGITAAVSAGVIGVTWLALEPASFRFAAQEKEEADPLRKAPPESLANAPSSYGDVPRLGPPLPGDLGRPIVDRQRELALSPRPVLGQGIGPGLDERALAAADAERQRVTAAREAARGSAVLVQLGGGREATAGAAPAAPMAGEGPQSGAAAATAASSGPADGQQHKIEFARSGAGDINPYPLQLSPSPWTLSAGTVISASLLTGLNSDLPGTVFAQVTENVPDSATGRTVLIPQGARLVGTYDSLIAYGQRRALVVWQRIVFPDGASVRLDNVPATDASGYAGVKDRIDSHTWRLLKGIALSTLLGVGTQLSLGSSESDLVRAIRESTQQNAGRAGDQITLKNLDVQPTLSVRPGWPLRAVIHKDLVLRPWRG